ncbi:prepilin-type N-terminal cleavage/methylation domain-containing protein [Aquisalimonas sp. 2447]|uniref:GspH/FimT family pseudopilin n=1 Tax=Aquisalimonas sp. 2447 TaxID=2740807 RepID=UPI0014324056|nr:GspH/FimT family pseudopilin [Aquisalimonas sp. 2447]QIT56614.1 prepilin-type N-terminal cleavage/methylation domain-containing protein [Aquisalimonas sp. 2447]
MRKRNGFTLIELMVTLAVAAILLTLGVPSFQYILQSNRVSTQTNELITGISGARSEAVRRNQDVLLVPIDGDWNRGFQIEVPALEDEDDEDDEFHVVRRFDTFGNGMDVTTTDANPITFAGRGSLTSGSGTPTITLQPERECRGDMRRVIEISASGSVQTTREACQ